MESVDHKRNTANQKHAHTNTRPRRHRRVLLGFRSSHAARVSYPKRNAANQKHQRPTSDSAHAVLGLLTTAQCGQYSTPQHEQAPEGHLRSLRAFRQYLVAGRQVPEPTRVGDGMLFDPLHHLPPEAAYLEPPALTFRPQSHRSKAGDGQTLKVDAQS